MLVRLTLLSSPYPARHILSTVQVNPGDSAPSDLERGERVLFVHAHPDDETISTGATIATLIDHGSVVTVLTCTRGELGEVIPADIRQLEGSNRLAAHRTRELAAAMGILGVRDHRFLGSADARWGARKPRIYTDSGMRWGAAGAEATDSIPEGSLCAAELGEVAADIAAVIESTGPTAVVSYDANGGYGHPDHIRAHDAAKRAAEVMNVPFFAIVEDGEIAIDGSAVIQRKRAALVAYRSQVVVDGDSFALSSGPSRPIQGIERFSRVLDHPPAQPGWKDQPFSVHILACALALVIGAAIGGISAVEHQLSFSMFGRQVPVGIAITLAIAAALFVGARLAFEGRLVAVFAAIGMLGAVGVLSLASSGGGILVPANAAGYWLIFGTAGVAAVSLAWPTSSPFRRDKLASTVQPKGTSSS